jgi:hypothetical protein
MNLLPGSGLFYPNKYIDTKNIRSEILHKYNHTCNYCSIKYDKSLYCICQDNEYYILCPLCYSIINPNHQNNLIVCLSNLDQKDIIKNTVKFIESDGRAPLYYEIDPNSKLVDISMFEFCNLIIKNKEITKDYKLFITDQTNINHIDCNLFYIKPNVEHKDTYVTVDKKLFL